MRTPILPTLAAVVFLGLAIAPARAGDDDHIAARAALQRGEILPLARILEQVQRREPGDVIEIELEREDEGWEYDVKVLTPSGVVRKLTLDARTGEVLKVKDDD
ncbi:PepSY domain-containing protein [Arenimonas composti]|uniref:PepSY domain-containing protein n=1 Tax=Arenimonas composti TR7-09 = DSM 18010 TaxID=1121013 RepID=A0A091BF93_9GAMM|nr:PepSY domain-containing protein [Arenimonas composti]KFN49449.1 hypothetical protein P873_10780 [Arenimonas composti TR7-09 = DSM 18010]